MQATSRGIFFSSSSPLLIRSFLVIPRTSCDAGTKPIESFARAVVDGNKRAKKLAGSVALAVKRMIGIGVLSYVVEGDRLWKVIGNLCRSRYVCFLPFVFVDR